MPAEEEDQPQAHEGDYETRWNQLKPDDIQVTDPEAYQEWTARRNWGPNDWLLEQEAELIRARRLIHGVQTPDFDKTSAQIFAWAKANKLTGLCFSGGGIRSATFNLGVLQGMAARGWLENFDYLSSVSGGGYIHSWLAGWLKRASKQQANTVAAWREVIGWLRPMPSAWHRSWPDQIQWLRRYSNYLTPRVGLLSGDTWAAFATWLRNVLLNQALLLFLFLALLCLPHLLAPNTYMALPAPATETSNHTTATVNVSPQETALSFQLTEKLETKPAAAAVASHFGERFASYFPPAPFTYKDLLPGSFLAGLALFLYLFGSGCIAVLLFREYREALVDQTPGVPPPPVQGTRPQPWEAPAQANLPKPRHAEFYWVCFGIVLPLLAFGIVMSEIVLRHAAGGGWTTKVFVLLLLLVWIETFFGGARANSSLYKKAMMSARAGQLTSPGFWWNAWNVLVLLLLGIPAAAFGALLAVAIAALMKSALIPTWSNWLLLTDSTAVEVILGTLLFFWLPPLTMVVTAGLVGKDFPDWIGEWLARVRAYTLVTGVGWICLCGCALLLPGAAAHLFRIHWAGWTTIGAWLVATFSGVITGKSGKTSGEPQSSNTVLDWVAAVTPYIYIAGLALLLSSALEYFRNEWRNTWLDVATRSWVLGNESRWLVAGLLLFGLALLLGVRLDVNQFSMHNFYRNRLTRCYLGASNLQRSPSPVTGFDERDSNDLFIHELKAPEYPGPIPIFCCAMNLTTGEDLAWQERKAASFALAPAYSGFVGVNQAMTARAKPTTIRATALCPPGCCIPAARPWPPRWPLPERRSAPTWGTTPIPPWRFC